MGCCCPALPSRSDSLCVCIAGSLQGLTAASAQQVDWKGCCAVPCCAVWRSRESLVKHLSSIATHRFHTQIYSATFCRCRFALTQASVSINLDAMLTSVRDFFERSARELHAKEQAMGHKASCGLCPNCRNACQTDMFVLHWLSLLNAPEVEAICEGDYV